MAKFFFYHGQDEGLLERVRDATKFCWGVVNESNLGCFHLFVAADDFPGSCHRTEDLIAAMSGYASSKERASTVFFTEVSSGAWPLDDEWTGSFASVVYSSARKEIVLCNDIIGHYPLYYMSTDRGLIGGTAQIALGRCLRLEPDPIGVLQRITVPFCNYGRRTMLKGVRRLLPGEHLSWSVESGGMRRRYDNSLCRNIVDTNRKDAARSVWNCLREEILTASKGSQTLSIATSGGWDSRLLLGAFPRDSTRVRCLTYGSKDLYETRVARRCAEAIGASHECFPIEEKYFPSREQVEPLIRECESANYFEWFGMIERARASEVKSPLLLGDLCESIDGRYMTTFSTRKARVDSFLTGIFGKGANFEEASKENFDEWHRREAERITSALLANVKLLSSELIGTYSEKQIREEVAQDLELSFARVSENAPPFAAMYDELFIWFHRIRFLLGNQINWLSSAFHAVSPGLSIRFLRSITRIHPEHKIRRRLMRAIAGLPEFRDLSTIPTAQIPFVSSRAPGPVKDAIWGLRSGVDQLLIRRRMRNKALGGRQRVLPSLDYVREYRRTTTAENVDGWFSEKFVRGDHYLSICRKRAELTAWPLINVDIAAPANVSIILDLCQSD